MKNNLTFKLFLISLVFTILACLSFLGLDLKNMGGQLASVEPLTGSWNQAQELLVEEKLDSSIKDLDINLLNSKLEILQGENLSYKIYGTSLKDLDNLEFEKEDGDFKIEDGALKDRAYRLVVYVPENQDLNIDYEGVRGDFTSQAQLSSLDISLAQGRVELIGSEAYRSHIEIIDGDLDMEFKSYKNNFNIGLLSGSLDFFGEELTQLELGHNFYRRLGNGPSIDIDLINGNIRIKKPAGDNTILTRKNI